MDKGSGCWKSSRDIVLGMFPVEDGNYHIVICVNINSPWSNMNPKVVVVMVMEILRNLYYM